MHKFKISKHHIIMIIYDALFFFFLFKTCFYMTFVGRFPDEMAHVSYIAYLQKTNTVIPDFKDMTILVKQSEDKNQSSLTAKMGYGGTYKFGKGFNYLGHPPLYYQIMRLSGGVQVKNGVITVDIVRLRLFNIMLAAIAMFLMFYIGFTRLGNVPAVHLLYGAVCVSVPMLAYDCAGVNNDTLALLGITVFLLGLLRLSEKRINYKTYVIISAGIAVTLLSKMVAGLAIVSAIAIFLFFSAFREKGLRFLFTKATLAALPACLISGVYYLLIYKQIGSFQPTFRKLAPAQFYASSFYVKNSNRKNYNFGEYAGYYWNSFMHTWTGIYSHISLLKPGNFLTLPNIGLTALWLLPLLLLLQVRKRIHYPMVATLISLYGGLLFTAAFQFFRAYYEFKNVSGYLGGYQSRYYLCLIPFIALAAVYAFGFLYDSNVALFRHGKGGREIILSERQWKLRRNAVKIFCIVFTILLLYEDFFYFLAHFNSYL